MLSNFFQLNSPFDRINGDQLATLLRTSNHIRNVLLEASPAQNTKLSDITFDNVSFSKKLLQYVTFASCVFRDCLFIGTRFDSVELHDCEFENCNFFKSRFVSVYAKPAQFRKAIPDKRYANIAVHLYHQLRENYYREAQREFKNEAEYQFRHWGRMNEWIQLRRKRIKIKWYRHGLRHLVSWLYDYLLGYGYRLSRQIVTTCAIVILVMVANHVCAEYLFSEATQPTVVKTVYLTLTTMATLGASGYSPDTEVGYMFVVFNVLIGISILSATVAAIFKKVIR